MRRVGHDWISNPVHRQFDSVFFSIRRTGFLVLKSRSWPVTTSLRVFCVAVRFIKLLKGRVSFWRIFVSLTCWVALLIMLFGWWKEIIYEESLKGRYTSRVKKNIWIGFSLFIVSEGFFFFAFFVRWFYCGVGEKRQICLGEWPPLGIKVVRPWGIPIVNTFLLLGSRACGRWRRKCVKIMGNFPKEPSLGWKFGLRRKKKFYETKREKRYAQGCALLSIMLCLFQGILFLILQFHEYKWCRFTMRDRAFGSCFFLLTGFHGFHVFVGLCFLAVCFVRILLGHFFSPRHHLGLKCALAYWHFVDGVWICLFFCVYLWPFFFSF